VFSKAIKSLVLSLYEGPSKLKAFSVIWNPMVKYGAIRFFSDQKSSSAGSSPVSPNRHGSTREQSIPPEPARTFKLMRMTGSKKYSPVGKKPSPVWGSIYDQRRFLVSGIQW
jgi:hypothetical protein